MHVGDGPGGAIIVVLRIVRIVVGGRRNLSDLVLIGVLIGVLLGEALPGVGPVVVVGQLDGVAVGHEVPAVLFLVKLDPHRAVRRDNVTGLGVAIRIKPPLVNRNARFDRLERAAEGTGMGLCLYVDVIGNVGASCSALKINGGVRRKNTRKHNISTSVNRHIRRRVHDVEHHIAHSAVIFTGSSILAIGKNHINVLKIKLFLALHININYNG